MDKTFVGDADAKAVRVSVGGQHQKNTDAVRVDTRADHRQIADFRLPAQPEYVLSY